MSLNITGRGQTIWEAAKQEWTKHICNLLVPVIEEGFRNIYTNCEKKIVENQRHGVSEIDEDSRAAVGVITMFKNTLLNIPKWNQEIIDEEFDRLERELAREGSKDVLDDLVKAAFTSHILILSSVNLSGQSNKKVELNIPTSKRFVHKIYIEAARVFYRNPHLFVPHYDTLESEYRFHKNAARIEQVLCNSVSEAISKLMPIRTILRAYMSSSGGEGEGCIDNGRAMQEVEDITRRVSPRSRRGLRNILKSYIKTTSEVIHPSNEDEAKEKEKEKELPWPAEKELPWPAEEHSQKEEGGGSSSDVRPGSGGEQDIVVEHVAAGPERRDSLLNRRMTPPPRSPRYRSPSSSKRSRHRREYSDDDDYRRSRRHDRERRGRSNRDRDRRRRRRRRESDDDRRHRHRDDRRRHPRDYRDDSEEENRRSRREREKKRGNITEEDEYNYDLLTLAGGEAPKESALNEPSINIEKNPTKKESRPRSVEFRLERSDEEQESKKDKKPKKRVTYKAVDSDQAFFPHLKDEKERTNAPKRKLPPTRHHSD